MTAAERGPGGEADNADRTRPDLGADRDFTFDAYEGLLRAAKEAGFEFLTVRDYLASEEHPDRYVVVRHDVDRKAENARKMAELEADLDVPTTYYFRRSTFDPERSTAVAAMGHEVGYHYEDLDRAGGDVRRAHDGFAEALTWFRHFVGVDTVCMHGNPLTPHDNRDMWRADETHPDFAAYDLLGEAYLSMDFTEVSYFSDTGRTWVDGPLKVKDHPVGESAKATSAETTAELAALLAGRRVERACLLVHPNRWADSYPELLAERAKDRAVNAVKRGLHFIS